MLFEARHCWYSLLYSEPQCEGDSSGHCLTLVDSEKFLVEATDSTIAAEKAFNHILAHPQDFSFQGMYLDWHKPEDYFNKHLFKSPPTKPVTNHHWIKVQPVAVISWPTL